MIVYAEQFFFSPSTDFSRLIPLFVFLGIAIIIILIVAFAIYYSRWEQKQKKDFHTFRSHAADYGLDKEYIKLLMRWAKWAKVRQLSRLLTNQEAFEKLIKKVERRGSSKHLEMGFKDEAVHRIRMQLFGKDITPGQKINTTLDLRPGLRLFMRYLDVQDTAVWAHLVDIEDDGLIVAVPKRKQIKVPLRPETCLEITAYIPKQEPVTFNTKVRRAIPGPRRMVLVDHSSFMIPKRNIAAAIPARTRSFVPGTA